MKKVSSQSKGIVRIALGLAIINRNKPIKKEIVGFHPNPVNDYVTVELPETLIGEKLTVINTLGQILRTIPINNTTVSINLNDLPKGVYYLITNNDSNAVKLIKGQLVFEMNCPDRGSFYL